MSETKKHREFWIEDRHEKDKPICKPYKKYVSTTPFGGLVGDEDYPNCEMIRAVELSALLEEKQKVKELVFFMKKMSDDGWLYGHATNNLKALKELIKKHGDV